MSISIKYPKTCFCISMKVVTTIIGLVGLGVGLLTFVSYISDAIYIMEAEDHNTHQDIMIFDIIKHFTFLYPDVMKILFSSFLVIGVFKNYPMKTCYPFSWIVYTGVTAFISALSIALHIKHMSFSIDIFIIEELVFLGIHLVSLYLVCSYYHYLPKQSLVRP